MACCVSISVTAELRCVLRLTDLIWSFWCWIPRTSFLIASSPSTLYLCTTKALNRRNKKCWSVVVVVVVVGVVVVALLIVVLSGTPDRLLSLSFCLFQKAPRLHGSVGQSRMFGLGSLWRMRCRWGVRNVEWPACIESPLHTSVTDPMSTHVASVDVSNFAHCLWKLYPWTCECGSLWYLPSRLWKWKTVGFYSKFSTRD